MGGPNTPEDGGRSIRFLQYGGSVPRAGCRKWEKDHVV